MKSRKGQVEPQQKNSKSDIAIITKGGGIATFGRICQTCISFVTRLIITRTMPLESVGLYYLGITVIEFSRMLSIMGLDTGLLKFASIAHGKKDLKQMSGYVNAAFKIAIPSAFIISLVLFFFSHSISVRLFHNPDLSKIIKALAVTIPFTIATAICIHATQACKKIQYRVYVKNIGEPLIRLAFLSVFIFIGYRLMGLLAAYIISVVLSLLLGLYFLNKKLPFSTKGTITYSQMFELLRFSLTLIFSRFIQALMGTVDTFMIGYFMAIGNVGIYNIALNLAGIGTMFLSSFNQIFAPLMSELVIKGDFERIKRNYQIVTKLVFFFSLPIYLIMIAFPREILMFFGADYAFGANCLVIIAAGQIVNSATGSVAVVLAMSGKHVIYLYSNIGMLVLNVILNYFLIPIYGISGAAVATFATVALSNSIRLILVYFMFGIQPYNLSYLKPLFIGTMMIMFFSGLKLFFPICLNMPYFLIVVISFFSLYFLLLKLVALTEEENLIVGKIKAKIFRN